MPKIPSKLMGSAGEHFVAYKLTVRGYIAALSSEGSPSVDILVSNLAGNKTLAVQVKATDWATRTRGRGKNKKPAELQFPLGYHSAKAQGENLIFAFVDMNDIESDTQPDVYIVPSQFVFDHCKSWVDEAKMVRLHVWIEEMQKFKNNWEPVASRLA